MDSNLEPRVLFTREEIEAGILRLARQIKADYAGKRPILISILKGSFIFMADLARHLDFPLEIEFIKVSSYGAGMESSGKIKVIQGLQIGIRDRHILIIDDIIDTGRTVSFLIDLLKKRKPASVKVCALADKPSRRQVPVNIDYLGFTVPDKFIVGFGIDWGEKFRCLPDICILERGEEGK